jgi:hypothetical protein
VRRTATTPPLLLNAEWRAYAYICRPLHARHICNTPTNRHLATLLPHCRRRCCWCCCWSVVCLTVVPCWAYLHHHTTTQACAAPLLDCRCCCCPAGQWRVCPPSRAGRITTTTTIRPCAAPLLDCHCCCCCSVVRLPALACWAHLYDLDKAVWQILTPLAGRKVLLCILNSLKVLHRAQPHTRLESQVYGARICFDCILLLFK